MFVADLILAFLVAALLTVALVPLERSRAAASPSFSVVSTALFVFLVLFFATWAGGIWLTPVGPPVWGSYWIPFVVIGVLIALFLATVGAPRPRPSEVQQRPARAPAPRPALFGLLFWLLLLALAGAVASNYVLV